MTRPRRNRIAWLFAACAAVGCHTDSRDKSALDLPSADQVRSRLALGPKAARLEVSPAEAANKTKAQQVLVATVYDADGQPRRDERVEWAIDGPGHIAASDESRLLTSRGHRSDSRSAVTYTDYFEGTADRGTADPADDFKVRAGQTWVVVASAVEGETTVTAHAPDVPDREKSRRRGQAGLVRLAVRLPVARGLPTRRRRRAAHHPEPVPRQGVRRTGCGCATGCSTAHGGAGVGVRGRDDGGALRRRAE